MSIFEISIMLSNQISHLIQKLWVRREQMQNDLTSVLFQNPGAVTSVHRHISNLSEYITAKQHHFTQEQNWKVSIRNSESGNVSFLSYFKLLFNTEQGHPLSSPCQLQEATDNTDRHQIMFTGSAEETSTRNSALLLTVYSFRKAMEN